MWPKTAETIGRGWLSVVYTIRTINNTNIPYSNSLSFITIVMIITFYLFPSSWFIRMRKFILSCRVNCPSLYSTLKRCFHKAIEEPSLLVFQRNTSQTAFPYERKASQSASSNTDSTKFITHQAMARAIYSRCKYLATFFTCLNYVIQEVC